MRHEREGERTRVEAVFLQQFLSKYVGDFWKPYIGMIALMSRANAESFLSILQPGGPKAPDMIIAELQNRGEDPTEWCVLVVLNQMPADIPAGEEFPERFVSDDGSITLRIRVEVIEGLVIN